MRRAVGVVRSAVRRGRRAPKQPAELAGRGLDLDGCTHPVLLLHGFLSSRRTVVLLERRLRAAGFTAFSLDLPSTRRGIDELAVQLHHEIERLYARHPGLGPLALVAHSQGGLVGAYYVKKLGGARRVRALVTLGTPHHGTPVALAGLPIAFLARSILQMSPRSPFLRRLNAGDWPETVRLTSVYSRRDGVVPFPSPLVGAGDRLDVRNVPVEGSHFDFLKDRAIHEVVVRELRAGHGPAPARLRARTAAAHRPHEAGATAAPPIASAA